MFEGRDWFANPPASQADLQALKEAVPSGVPGAYFELLAYSNGGEGPLPMLPFNFCLDPISTVRQAAESRNYDRPDLDGFFVIGGNGGGELIALDLRGGQPFPIVALEMAAGAESAETIAPDLQSFMDMIGLDAA